MRWQKYKPLPKDCAWKHITNQPFLKRLNHFFFLQKSPNGSWNMYPQEEFTGRRTSLQLMHGRPSLCLRYYSLGHPWTSLTAAAAAAARARTMDDRRRRRRRRGDISLPPANPSYKIMPGARTAAGLKERARLLHRARASLCICARQAAEAIFCAHCCLPHQCLCACFFSPPAPCSGRGRIYTRWLARN